MKAGETVQGKPRSGISLPPACLDYRLPAVRRPGAFFACVRRTLNFRFWVFFRAWFFLGSHFFLRADFFGLCMSRRALRCMVCSWALTGLQRRLDLPLANGLLRLLVCVCTNGTAGFRVAILCAAFGSWLICRRVAYGFGFYLAWGTTATALRLV